jgi:transposase
MAYIQGEGRSQQTLFPVVLDDLVQSDHMCRVVHAFVEHLDMKKLGFERAQPEDTGRPGYDPRALLKLYLYGYLNQICSSRRLEAECRRNVEVMWLLERLYPDHKSIAEFRRVHRDAVTSAGAELVRFAKSCGLIRGEWIAVDGSKFRAVASVDSTRERIALQRYLDGVDKADEEQHASIDHSAVQTALEKLKNHPEPEANYMLVRQTVLPAYNVQTAVDTEHALIVAHDVVLDAIKYRIFGHPRLLMRGLSGARVEISIATMAYNLKRITNVLGVAKTTKALQHSC